MTTRLDASHLSPDDFWFKPTPLGTLITPTPVKHQWSADERPFRSVILGDDGTVRSSGFPKFHNVGEVPDQDRDLAEAAGRGEVTYSEKLDGSLIIMDWIDGRVHMRSRGTWTVEDSLPAVPGLVRQLGIDPSAILGDPQGSHLSLLFEYTAPDNRIVLAYDESALTLLGAVDKRDLSVLVDQAEVLRWASAIKAPAVAVRPLAGSLDEVAGGVAEERDLEGVVARYQHRDGSWRLSKLKSVWYRDLHSLLSGLTPKKAIEHLVRGGLMGPSGVGDHMVEVLSALGLDAEQVSFVRPIFEESSEKMKAAEAALDAVASLCSSMRPGPLDRESAAELRALVGTGPEFHAAIQLLRCQRVEAWSIMAARELGVPVGSLRGWLRSAPPAVPPEAARTR